MVGITLLGIFVLLLAFGAPIATCLGLSSVAAILVQGAGKPIDAVMSVLPRLCSSASSKFVLLAIPFFILSGNVMEKAGISGRLINIAKYGRPQGNPQEQYSDDMINQAVSEKTMETLEELTEGEDK